MNTNNSYQKATEMTELMYGLFQKCRSREERHAQKFGVSVAEFRCLRTLNSGDGLVAKKLAAKLGLTSSRLTRIIDGMVHKDLIVRKTINSDRRTIQILLSKKGKNLAQDSNNAYIEVHSQILDKIENLEHTILLSTLKSLLSAMEYI